MRTLKCSLVGCSNRAFSLITVNNDVFDFDDHRVPQAPRCNHG